MDDKKLTRNNEAGFTIVVVMILLTLTAFLVREALKRTQAGTSVIYETKKRSSRYYEVEDSFNKAVIHLRDNGHLYASIFSRANFYAKFARIGTTVVGINDVSSLSIPTQITKNGAVTDPPPAQILVNDATLGTENFPTSTNIITGAAVDLVATFAAANFGSSMVRLTMLDALAENPSGDTATPTTDFEPIYRLDSMTSLTDGPHLSGIIQGDIVNLYDYGVYGKDTITFAGSCDSYDSATSDYDVSGNKTASCLGGFFHATNVPSITGTVYGSFHSSYRESALAGLVCSDFTGGCPTAGKVCGGRECAANLLDQFPSSTFTDTCPTNQGAAIANPAATPVTSVSSCWSTFGGRTTGTITLTACTGPGTGPGTCSNIPTLYPGPYYAATFYLQTSATQLSIAPTIAGQVIEFYFWAVSSNASYPNTIYDTNITNTLRPFQLRLYYMGTTAITLAGTTQPLRAFIVAPYAQVTVSANMDIRGGVLAKDLIVNSGAQIHYDSSIVGEGLVEDMQYRIRSMNQVYR